MVSNQDIRERLKTALADRYRIEREIGSGGTATVYLAEDLKHRRQVAVKVLDPDLARTLGAERFLREIETAARLSHPHILPLHDSGEADGFLFYVMPYVKGESLRDRLARETQLPLEDAIRITREIADALDHAHGEGVIHRDVKPGNILLSGGHALLADFGIAHALAGADRTALTRTGVSVGTPAYMSPEQATGARDLDGRSDQYALGCVLYEMLAGHPPFTGAQVESVVRQHLTEDPRSVTGIRPAVPEPVAQALNRSLAKNPADRFRTTGAMAAALDQVQPARRTRGLFGRAKTAIYGGMVILGMATAAVLASRLGPPGPELVRDRVLVLPFSNRTGDPSLDDFSGYATYLTAIGLAQSGIVGVAPPEPVLQSWTARTESGREGSSFDSRRAIAEEFGAGILVEGSVLAGPDSLRITLGFAGADRPEEVRYLSPVSVPRARRDEGAVMKNVAETLAAALALRLDRGWEPWSSRHFSPPPSLAVWLEMRNVGDLFHRGELEEALRHAEAATALDPTYLPAKLHQAVALLNLGRYRQADSVLSEVERSPTELPPGNRTQAEWLRARLDGDREGAYRAVKEGHVGYSQWIWAWGFEALGLNRPDEALEVLSGLDPEAPSMRMVSSYWEDLGEVLHVLGDHDRELREARRGRALHPEAPGVMDAELRAHAALGHVREVHELLEEIGNRDPTRAVRVFQVAAGELRAHGHEDASAAVADAALAYVTDPPRGGPEPQAHRYDLLRVLYLLERWEEAHRVAGELVREAPTNPDYLGYLGTLAARLGEGPEADGISARIRALEIPYDAGNATYWRARIAAVLGEREEAVRLLHEAHAEGLPFSVDLHTERDLDSLRDYPPFQEFMRPKG